MFCFSIFFYNDLYSQNIDKSKDSSYVLIQNVYYHKDSVFFKYDSLETYHLQYITNDNSFLINDSKYYSFKVISIYKLEDAFFIQLQTQIDNRNVIAYVVSVNLKDKNKDKIKIGKTYRMKLLRYYEKPLSRSIEYKKNYDLMIGNHLVSILSTGWFPYIFVTQNLRGLNYINEIDTSLSVLKIPQNDFNKIDTLSCNLVKKIYDHDFSFLMKHCDTLLIKDIIKKYHVDVPDRTLVEKLMLTKRVLPPPKNVPLNNWLFSKVDTSKNFKDFFEEVVSIYYPFPINMNYKSDRLIDCREIKWQVIYFLDGIYTIRIKWKMFSSKNDIYVFINIKKIGDEYKIVGFNRVI